MKKYLKKICLIFSAVFPIVFVTTAEAKTYWACAAIVPISKQVVPKLGLFGPALRWKITYNAYIGVFENNDEYASSLSFADKYESEYKAFLLSSGYSLDSLIADGATTSACVPKSTATEANTLAAEWASDSSSNNVVDQKMNPVYVQWKPTQNAEIPSTSPQSQNDITAQRVPGERHLGVGLQDVNAQTAEFAGLKDTKGALIMKLEKDSIAEKSGLKQMDIITEISGQTITTADDVRPIILKFRTGYKAIFRVWRDKNFVEIPVEMPEGTVAPDTTTPSATSTSTPAESAAVNQLAQAVERALDTEKAARVKAKEAEEVATKAIEIATQAEEAAKRAENGETGYVKKSYTISNAGYLQKMYFSGQDYNNSSKFFGVKTFKDDKSKRFVGEFSLSDYDAVVGKTKVPKIDGYGIQYGSNYMQASKWINGQNEGLSVFTFNNDIQYGEFKDGVLNGLALIVFRGKTQGQFSAGEFKDNELNGYGVTILSSGKRWVGQFENRLLDGYGIEYAADGSVLQQGIWKNGVLITPIK